MSGSYTSNFRHPRAGGDPTSNTSYWSKLDSRLRGNDGLNVCEPTW